MGVMKMGNIVPTAGIKPTYLAFWASVLLLHHVGSLMSPLYPCLCVYADPCLRGQYRHIYIDIKPIHIYYMHISELIQSRVRLTLIREVPDLYVSRYIATSTFFYVRH